MLSGLQEALRVEAFEVDDANPGKDVGEAARILLDVEYLQARQVGEAEALAAGTQQPAVMGAIGKLSAAKQKFGEGAGLIQAASAQTDKYNAVL
ncbi:hypothetical protein OG423_05100 [Micromonospora zamorensis]|uniref:hypothetical protein n=1 Tax=Micromonospora zamorensis TaxID=709883 RepID=UPI000C6BF6EE|nr:hypothetical protein OG423_05100 [Micromonospora zamorensis]